MVCGRVGTLWYVGAGCCMDVVWRVGAAAAAVWYAVYGMVWHGMVWFGMVWYGMCYGMVWYGIVW